MSTDHPITFEDEIILHYCQKLSHWVFRPGQVDATTKEIRDKFSKYFRSCFKLLDFGFCEVAITISYMNKVSEFYSEAFSDPKISILKLIFATCCSIVHKIHDDKVFRERDLERIFNVKGLGKAEVMFCQRTDFRIILSVAEVTKLLVDLKTQFLLDCVRSFSSAIKIRDFVQLFKSSH